MSRRESSSPRSIPLTRRTIVGVGALALAHCGGQTTFHGDGTGGDGDTGGSTGSTGGAPGTGGKTATGGSTGSTGGASGMGGQPVSADAGAEGGAGGSPDGGDFPADARIEAGRPDGMTGTSTPGVCTRTDANDEGPFYLANAPFRSVLADKSDGEWLIVTGRVLNTKCEGVPGAIVDVWHSDGAPDGQSDYDNDPKGQFRWRGKIKADSDGSYMYETIKPGRYNNGGQLRPCHIHYKISGAGYPTLTTQFQPKGDTAFDGISKHSLDVPFVKENGIWKTKIDIVFRANMAMRAPEREDPPRVPRRSFFFLGGSKRA
jgi:protocatechuate 3,4-dioxygenase beta subunit